LGWIQFRPSIAPSVDRDYEGSDKSVSLMTKPGKSLFPILLINRFKFCHFIFLGSILLFSLPPSNAHSAQVKLAWDPNTDPSIAGYKVYYGTASRSYQSVVDVGNIPTCTISNLPEGITYYFAVTDYDSSRAESGYSNEVVYSPIPLTDPTPPTVTSFSIPATSTRLTIPITAFTATDDVGVAGYMVKESAAAPAASAVGWSNAPPRSYRFASAGNKTLYAWAKDAAGNVSASRAASVTITLSGPTIEPVILGIYRGGSWYWDNNGNEIWDGCGVDTCLESSFGGYPEDIPVVGDWTGDGIRKIGVYRKGSWYLDLNGNGVWDGCGVDACIASFGGLPGDIPVVGDWTGNGIDKLGIYRQGQWFKDLNGNRVWDGCGVDACIASFGGLPGDVPVVGDWTGNGIDKLGIYRQGQWFKDLNNNGTWDGCGVDACVASFGGLPEDVPVVGDWTGDGIAKLGIYRQGQWFKDLNNNGTWDGCGVDACIESFGGFALDIPFVK